MNWYCSICGTKMSNDYNACSGCNAPKIANNVSTEDMILFTLRSMSRDIKFLTTFFKIFIILSFIGTFALLFL